MGRAKQIPKVISILRDKNLHRFLMCDSCQPIRSGPPHFCITQCLQCFRVPVRIHPKDPRSYPLVSASSRCQTSLRYSGDARKFVAAERKQDCRGLARKFSDLLDDGKYSICFYALMHDETNLFNQQEFLLNSN